MPAELPTTKTSRSILKVYMKENALPCQQQTWSEGDGFTFVFRSFPQFFFFFGNCKRNSARLSFFTGSFIKLFFCLPGSGHPVSTWLQGERLQVLQPTAAWDVSPGCGPSRRAAAFCHHPGPACPPRLRPERAAITH